MSGSMMDHHAFPNDDEEIVGDAEEADIYPKPSAPLAVARQLYSSYVDPKHVRTLIFWRGNWMRWNITDWSEIDTAELRSNIYTELEHARYDAGEEFRDWDPDRRKVANVMEAMEAVGFVDSSLDPPSWIDVHSADGIAAQQLISCRNGLLNLATRQLIDHTPALLNVVAVPFDYEPDACRR